MKLFPWQRDKDLKEAVRLERGRLAAEIVRNDRVRSRLTKARETPISDMLTSMMAQLDGAKRD